MDHWRRTTRSVSVEDEWKSEEEEKLWENVYFFFEIGSSGVDIDAVEGKGNI